MADPGAPTRVLLISHDIVGEVMAGPGIRYLHLARELSAHADVQLAVVESERKNNAVTDIQLTPYRPRDWESIAAAAHWAEVIVLPTDSAEQFPQLAKLDVALVIDGYDPLLAEWLALFADLPAAEWERAWSTRMTELHHQYLVGDFYICASERQRNWWLGQLEAAGRLHPATFRADPSLRNLVDVVPYGLRSDAPVSAGPVVRGVWPDIGDDDILLLWGGGLWPWLDPVTAIRAVARVRETRPDVKLIFPGTRHPNPIMQGMPTQNEAAFACAEALGLRERGVYFGDWVPYARWPSLLLECDFALSLHFDTVETQLAFRSRLLDYIWASLPCVVTRGDATSDLVAQHQLGHVVDYGDVDGVANAIMALIDKSAGRGDPSRQVRFDAVRKQLTWRNAAEPLIRFCTAPRRAPDRVAPGVVPAAPYYRTQIEELQAELDAAHSQVAALTRLVKGYESGRVMRAMQGFSRWRSQLTGGAK